MYQNDRYSLKCLHEFRWRSGPSCFAVANDRKTFVSGHFCGDLKRGCLETGEVIYHVRKNDNNTKWIRSIAIDLSLEIFITGSEDKTIRIWNLNDGEQIDIFTTESPVRSICFDRALMLLISGHENGLINVWDLQKRKLAFCLRGHLNSVDNLILSPNSNMLVSGSKDSSIKIWDLWSESEIKTIYGPTACICSLCLSLDFKTVISGGEEPYSFVCWDRKTGVSKHFFTGHLDLISDIINTPDPNIIISASCDRTVRLWNIATGKEIKILEDGFYGVPTLATSPNLKTIIVGGAPRDFVSIWQWCEK